MSDRQKETEFLKWLIGYGDPEQCRDLRHRIHKLQHEQFCLRRIMVLMTVLNLVAFSGFCYAVVMVPDWMGRTLPWVVRLSCALGLSSSISLLACFGYWFKQRLRLDAIHDECRQIVKNIVQGQLTCADVTETYLPANTLRFREPRSLEHLPIAS